MKDSEVAEEDTDQYFEIVVETDLKLSGTALQRFCGISKTETFEDRCISARLSLMKADSHEIAEKRSGDQYNEHFLGGDLNSHHRKRNCTRANSFGINLYNFTNDNRIHSAAPPPPTEGAHVEPRPQMNRRRFPETAKTKCLKKDAAEATSHALQNCQNSANICCIEYHQAPSGATPVKCPTNSPSLILLHRQIERQLPRFHQTISPSANPTNVAEPCQNNLDCADIIAELIKLVTAGLPYNSEAFNMRRNSDNEDFIITVPAETTDLAEDLPGVGGASQRCAQTSLRTLNSNFGERDLPIDPRLTFPSHSFHAATATQKNPMGESKTWHKLPKREYELILRINEIGKKLQNEEQHREIALYLRTTKAIINKFTGEKIKRQEGKLSVEIKADILALEDGLLEKDVSHQVPAPMGKENTVFKSCVRQIGRNKISLWATGIPRSSRKRLF
ncbi:hypothetical protein CEXT_801741 [Caerostris extrusa]|uniref:Uncharacterized protein n=1 Tax=Caerostris extrusa TaxID=172846 RepID=A0AAV4W502_CAEEX|nr:hypothetical protein CEXT_801741 [Caerostris extrusa]